jgi:hypothetical protein
MAVLAALAVSAYFRFSQLSAVPYEMWSDHAEKLLDVVDVLNGRYSIFFPRNTGREALQFYMAAATAKLLGTGVSFLTLKIGTALAGFLTLPYLYLFAREIGGRWSGLAAVLLGGVGYWPNVISRIGLRFPLYPLFAAPALYYLLRGLRLKRRNDLLLVGLAIGVGLHGYSPTRALPIAVTVGVLVFLLHREARGGRLRVLGWLLAAGAVAFVILTPLLRVALEMPDLFLFRTLSRIGTAERPLPGPAGWILLSNLWNGLRMFAWDNGRIWVISVPGRPALDWVTGALFHLGVAALVVRYIRSRNWQDIFVLVSIPILMLPSILSLAFPEENPAPNRAAGVMVPVFAVAGLGLAALPGWARSVLRTRSAHRAALAVGLGLFLISASVNYRLVFVDYYNQHRLGTWNTREAGQVVRGFATSIGDYDTAHVIAYPYWMDTRLVGMLAGKPTRDYGMWPDQVESLPPETRAQLFILNVQDEVGLASLRDRFPTGTVSRWRSPTEGRDFLIFFVPAQPELEPAPAGEDEP